MRSQSFYDWLTKEVATSRMALIALYEKRDNILYVEAPKLRKKYMDIIGNFEEAVLQSELEVSILHHKMELIQIAINRRERIDLNAIESKLEAEKQKKISELESSDITLSELPELTEQQEHTLQRQYREITSSFHPALNPDITETQKELYQKAVEAYKMQDVEAMKLIYDMLFSPVDMIGLEFSIEDHELSSEEKRLKYRAMATALSTDYLLAKKLYSCFSPLEEDNVVLDKINNYNEQRNEIENEIAQIKSAFPFNAVSTIENPAKTEEYLAELRIRAKRCESEKDELEKKIKTLTEEHSNG